MEMDWNMGRTERFCRGTPSRCAEHSIAIEGMRRPLVRRELGCGGPFHAMAQVE